jgi:hypothetical protein
LFWVVGGIYVNDTVEIKNVIVDGYVIRGPGANTYISGSIIWICCI